MMDKVAKIQEITFRSISNANVCIRWTSTTQKCRVKWIKSDFLINICCSSQAFPNQPVHTWMDALSTYVCSSHCHCQAKDYLVHVVRAILEQRTWDHSFLPNEFQGNWDFSKLSFGKNQV